MQQHESDLIRIRKLRLLDDSFMTKVFEDDIASTQVMLRIILGRDDIEVLQVKTQATVKSLEGRSVRLDILANGPEGVFNVEVQRADRENERKRARYHSAVLDAALLKPGMDFNQLPESYIIFITEDDILHNKRLYTHFTRKSDDGELFQDGTHIIFVNASARDHSPLGILMQDFTESNPDAMQIP